MPFAWRRMRRQTASKLQAGASEGAPRLAFPLRDVVSGPVVLLEVTLETEKGWKMRRGAACPG